MSKSFVPLALLLLSVSCTSAAQSAGQASSKEVVATVDGATITLGEVDALAMLEQANDFGNVRLGQALYQARRSALDRLIARRLFEQEAKAKGVDVDGLVRQEITEKTTAVSDKDVEEWFGANPTAVKDRTIDQLRKPIHSLLTEQRAAESHDRFVNALKAKAKIAERLDPPRLAVATTGNPSRGPAQAPIEIVEFSDFQCPFCRRVNPTVDQVLTTYGDKIRFVYRHYPLPNHANARPAAEASACADAQGQFWKYHDLLFANPDKLTDADLKGHAASLGLDTAAFNTCVDTHATKGTVDRDMKDAEVLGVSATPSFYINGRAVEGAQPFDVFKRVIDEELAIRK